MDELLVQNELHKYFKDILFFGSERAIADMVIQAIDKDENRFRTVLEMCFTEKYPINMRAARAIQLYCEKDAGFLLKDLDKIMVRSLDSEIEGVKRNFLKIFSEYLDFSLICHSGLLLNKCFDMLMDAAEKPGIRCYSMLLLYKYAVHEKDIAKELEEILDFLHEETAPSIIGCKSKILKKLRSNKGY